LAITAALNNLLHQARQRHSLNLVFEYLAVAGGIGAAGVILLLILGRQILDWYWPVLLFVGALAAGLYRARQRMLSGYRLAQVVDARLGLEDRLSTLVWCEENGAPAEFTSVIAKQAEERIHPGDAVRAVPVNFPRYGYACAGLLTAALGMLGVRYGMLHTMDLNPPIANIRFEPLQPEPKAYASTKKKSAIQERWEEQLKELGLTPQDLEVPDDNALKPIEQEIPAAANDPKAAAAEKMDGVKDMKAPAEEGDAPEDGGDKAAGDKSDNASAADSNSQDQKGQPSKKNDAPQNAKQGQQGSQDGLLNKMRDAMANLMNKLKNNNQDQQQASQQGNPNPQQGQQARQQQQQQGMQSQGKQQGEGQPSADQEGQQQSGEKMAGDKSKPGDKNGDRPGDQNAKSGMGQQDGEKAIREAKQLEAMGKISEILGKRAQQITGEMSVEVSSGRQQLKTQWSERRALHSDTGAETNRNEIPLAYQTYIQRYFEEVRKTPGARSKAPANP
jgi:hypothetical protein